MYSLGMRREQSSWIVLTDFSGSRSMIMESEGSAQA